MLPYYRSLFLSDKARDKGSKEKSLGDKGTKTKTLGKQRNQKENYERIGVVVGDFFDIITNVDINAEFW